MDLVTPRGREHWRFFPNLNWVRHITLKAYTRLPRVMGIDSEFVGQSASIDPIVI